MLCDLVEAGKVCTCAIVAAVVYADVIMIVCLPLQEVCYQYWPRGGSQTYGEFTVELLGEEKFNGFSLRTFGAFNSKVSALLSNEMWD